MTESSKTKRRSEVRVAPTTCDDLPGIITCELLAFSGAFPPYELLFHLVRPFRAPLARAGIHPRHWPEFSNKIRERSQTLRDGSILFTAFVKGEDGKELIAGGAWMIPPRDLLKRAQEEKKWTDRMLNNVMNPMVANIRDKLWENCDGLNVRFMTTMKNELEVTRNRVDPKRRSFLLYQLYVHPSFQGMGIGSALLAKCISVADVEGRPLMLESTEAGMPLYSSRGFVQDDVVDIKFSGERVLLPSMIRQPVSSANG